jgi:hypothetical protein
MSIIVVIHDGPQGFEIHMKRLETGEPTENPDAHLAMANILEPAIYEAVRECVRRKIIGTTYITWDNQRIEVKSGK